MNRIKTIFLLIFLISINGCVQHTSLMGPVITVATTGNIYQTGLSYTTSQLIQHETGKSTLTHLNDFLENIENKKAETKKAETKKIAKLAPKRTAEDFFMLIENRIKKTAGIIYLED